MKTYCVTVYWKFASENIEYGLILANSEEEAVSKVKNIYPDAKDIYVHELEFNQNHYYCVYSH